MSVVIWTPDGMVDSKVLSINKALNEYDERLFLETDHKGDWVIWIHQERPKRPWPCFNLGRNLPDKDEVMLRVIKGDMLRRGTKILDEVNEHNDRLRATEESKMKELDTMMAEVLESAAHRYGGTRYHRSLPKRDPKQQNKGD